MTDFEKQCLPHLDKLRAFARKISRSDADADDLAQETVMQAMLHWHAFDPSRSVRQWLFKILANTYVDLYRKRATRTRLHEERRQDVLSALYTETCAGFDISDEVERALDTLRQDYREIVLRDLRGESHRHIAAAMNIPLHILTGRLFRARRYLERELADYARREYGIAGRRPVSDRRDRLRARDAA